MKSATHKMSEAITAALGPIFHANSDYKTITEAIALTVARVAQATPDKGFELHELDSIHELANKALETFLNEEEALLEAKAKIVAKGVDAFAEMARSDGDDVSKEEFYENSGLNPKHYGPAFGLAALHGDLGVEARDAAEAFAGQDHAEVERPACRPYRDEDGNITPEGHIQLKKDILALHTPDDDLTGPEHNEGSWSNSPIHEEIARFEQEHPEVNNGYEPDRHNPDGPRAYL
jgi:hypothetical protein